MSRWSGECCLSIAVLVLVQVPVLALVLLFDVVLRGDGTTRATAVGCGSVCL